MQHPKRQSLKRTLNFRNILTFAVGTMVGGVWVVLAGHWVELAGFGGAGLAFLITALLCVLVSLTYAELTPALPLAGGELIFSYRGLGFYASWFTGWMTAFAYAGIVAWEGLALASVINNLFSIPPFGYLWTVGGFDVHVSWALSGAAGGLIIAAVNYLGVRASAVLQSTALLAVGLGGVCFLTGGAAGGSFENMGPAFTDLSGFFAVIAMAPAMFIGFDIIPQMAEEMDLPLKQIPAVLVLSICLALAWYLLVIASVSVAAPANIRGSGTVSMADALAWCTRSPALGKLMIVAGLCGVITSWNGFFFASTRLIFSMGRARMLPAVFGRLHPKRGVPGAAIALVGLIACVSPLLGRSALVWFVNASSFAMVTAYGMVALSFLALRKYEPTLNRPCRVWGGPLAGVLALIVIAFFMYLYLPFGPVALRPVEWALVSGWIMLGITMFALTQEKYRDTSPQEREYLLFGNAHARRRYTVDPILFSMTRPGREILSREEKDFLLDVFKPPQKRNPAFSEQPADSPPDSGKNDSRARLAPKGRGKPPLDEGKRPA